MIVELADKRLSMLRDLGEVCVIDGKTEDALKIVHERTEGLGADVVSVCAPAREPQEQAPQYARKGGAVSLFASLPKGASEITLDSRTIHYNELRVVGASDSRPEHVAKIVQLMAEGRLDPAPVVTHRVPLEELQKGIELMIDALGFALVCTPRCDVLCTVAVELDAQSCPIRERHKAVLERAG